MSPVSRRDVRPFVFLLVVGAIVLFLLVGGLASVGGASGPYRSTIDQSFAAQVRVLIDQSNQVGAQLRTVVSQAPGYNRTELSQALDSIVAGADAVERSTPDVSAIDARITDDFVAAMVDRATAASLFRRAVDGLLRLTPTPDSQSSVQGSPYPPPVVTVAQADHELSTAGSLLVGADTSYREAQRLFARAPGGSRLNNSVWVPSSVVWSASNVGTLVDQLSSAPNLQMRVEVDLVAVALDPPVLPPPPASSAGQPQAPPIPQGSSEVPPTCTLSVTAVVRNQGSVVVKRVAVQASAQEVRGGAPFVVKKLVTLAPARSAALALPAIPVAPGSTYNLTVNLGSPPGQSPPPAARAATIVVASYGSAKGNARCARTPAAAP